MNKIFILSLLIGSILSVSWPNPKGTIPLTKPITVEAGKTFDGFAENGGQWMRYERGITGLGDCTKVEGGSKDPVFILKTGAKLKNVVLGPNSIEHVHCVGDGCTVENVYWEDVCEDALTLRDSTNTNAKFYVKGGAARNGSDKIIQHNSAGTVIISNFYVENSGKLYRACGNCKKGYQNKRAVELKNVEARNVKVLAGINSNFGDTAKFNNVIYSGGHACQKFFGVNDGKEPEKNGKPVDKSGSWTCS